MTPFGERIRALRKERGITLKQMAEHLEVSPAYLSALEHGHRGKPSWWLVQHICGYLGIIWDDAEELARLAKVSHPRIVIDTSGLDARATELANLMAQKVGKLTPDEIEKMMALLQTK